MHFPPQALWQKWVPVFIPSCLVVWPMSGSCPTISPMNGTTRAGSATTPGTCGLFAKSSIVPMPRIYTGGGSSAASYGGGPGTEVSPCPVLHRAVMEGNCPAMRRAYQTERANDRVATVSICSSSSLQIHKSIFNHGHWILQRASSRSFREIFLLGLLEANELFSMHCTRGRCSFPL